TDESKVLLEHAKNVIEKAELFKNACSAQQSIPHGKFKVAVGIPLQEVFFKAMTQFMKHYPMVQFEFWDGDRATQLSYLDENKVDFCLTVHPVSKIHHTSERIIDLPM